MPIPLCGLNKAAAAARPESAKDRLTERTPIPPTFPRCERRQSPSTPCNALTDQLRQVTMKRKSDDSLEPGFNNVKPIKSEKDGNADYSQDVKKKINASARTGQACDRCRVSALLLL